MNKLTGVCAALAAVICIAGCMSMDEMLASDNDVLRDIGESRAVSMATSNDGGNTLEERLAVVPKIRNQKKLANIYVSKTAAAEVKKAARERMTETAAFVHVILNSDDKAIQKDALAQVSKDDDARIDAAWAIAIARPESNAPGTLVKGVKDSKKLSRFVADKIGEMQSFSDEISRRRSKYGDAFVVGDQQTLSAMALATKKFAPYATDADVIRPILPKVADTKGSPYDLYTPLSNAIGSGSSVMSNGAAGGETVKKTATGKLTKKELERTRQEDMNLYKEVVMRGKDKICWFSGESSDGDSLVSALRHAPLDFVEEHAADVVKEQNGAYHREMWTNKDLRFFGFAKTVAERTQKPDVKGAMLALAMSKLETIGRGLRDRTHFDGNRVWKWDDYKPQVDGELSQWRAIVKDEGSFLAAVRYAAANNLDCGDYIEILAGDEMKDKLAAARIEGAAAGGEEEFKKFASEEPRTLIKDMASGSIATNIMRVIARKHENAKVRLFAALSSGGDSFDEFCKTANVAEPGDNLSVNGFYLGMDIVSAAVNFHRLFPECPLSMKYANRWVGVNYDELEENLYMSAQIDGKDKIVVRSDMANESSAETIMLFPELVEKLYGDPEDAPETAQSDMNRTFGGDSHAKMVDYGLMIFGKIGVKPEVKSITPKLGDGTLLAVQSTLYYKPLMGKGGEIYFAVQDPDVQFEGGGAADSAEEAAFMSGYVAGCYAVLNSVTGPAGTIVLKGKPIKVKKPQNRQ